MPKAIYCAQCGTELYFALKALSKAKVVVTVIEPHKCAKDTKENPYKDSNDELLLKPKTSNKNRNLDKMFEGFKFAKDLGGKDSLPTETIFDRSSGDKRPKEDKRDSSKDVNSLAPQGVLGAVKDLNPSTPEHELEE